MEKGLDTQSGPLDLEDFNGMSIQRVDLFLPFRCQGHAAPTPI